MSTFYFWNATSVFSNWNMETPFELDDRKFNCAEQCMMYCKAMLFGDEKTAAKILASDDPAEQQKLGRKVANFKQDIWDREKEGVVYKALVAKFSQNREAREKLLSTKGQLIAEASPWDAVWGTGLSERDSKRAGPDKWPGRNLLGKLLVKVRETVSTARSPSAN